MSRGTELFAVGVGREGARGPTQDSCGRVEGKAVPERFAEVGA